ncbi:MAG: MBL fold metallo-hydrolase [Fervidobacterium sp.]|uniref:MBL fold metallo-hydrolase n=1 Tax=Fervidobacterium sp. TaxID=1871331 RepID=UPI00404ABB44
MFDVIKLDESFFVLKSPVNVGMILKGDEAVLIDTGSSSDHAKRIARILGELSVRKVLIINTHSHADHIGGNSFLQSKYRCRIFATKLESAFIENPVLEPAYLWGALPFKGIDNKFLLAKPSVVTDIIDYGISEELNVDVIPLSGHSFDMIGILTNQTNKRIFFIADSIVSSQTIQKYKVYFLVDVAKHLKTLESLKLWVENDVSFIVPSHGEVYNLESDQSMEEFLRLVELNKSVVHETVNTILNYLDVPKIIDDIVSHVAEKFSLSLDASGYVLLLQTLKAYCNYLFENDYVQIIFQNKRLEYVRKQ